MALQHNGIRDRLIILLIIIAVVVVVATNCQMKILVSLICTVLNLIHFLPLTLFLNSLLKVSQWHIVHLDFFS